MKERFTEEQIVRILKEAEARMSARDACRKHNVTKQPFTGGRRSTAAWTSVRSSACRYWSARMRS